MSFLSTPLRLILQPFHRTLAGFLLKRRPSSSPTAAIETYHHHPTTEEMRGRQWKWAEVWKFKLHFHFFQNSSSDCWSLLHSPLLRAGTLSVCHYFTGRTIGGSNAVNEVVIRWNEEELLRSNLISVLRTVIPWIRLPGNLLRLLLMLRPRRLRRWP